MGNPIAAIFYQGGFLPPAQAGRALIKTDLGTAASNLAIIYGGLGQESASSGEGKLRQAIDFFYDAYEQRDVSKVKRLQRLVARMITNLRPKDWNRLLAGVHWHPQALNRFALEEMSRAHFLNLVGTNRPFQKAEMSVVYGLPSQRTTPSHPVRQEAKTDDVKGTGGTTSDPSNINQQALKFLKKEEVNAFNKLREANPDWKPDLRSVSLYSTGLRGANLSEADLSGADLSGANLRKVNLRGANLRGADLCRADMSLADLCRADLRGADLSDANLGKAYLGAADLRGANLCRANLCGANLRSANLSEADLSGANLRGVKNLTVD